MHDVHHHHHHHRRSRRYCSDQEDQDNVSLDLNNLKVISVLGRGAKGVVFLVQTEMFELLAVKVILRSSIEKKKNKSNGEEYRRICFEREVLSNFHHPLLPKLHGVLKTDKVVGYAIDYCSGRDLNVLRKNQTEKMFSTDIIRFYAAELVLALEYLHGLGIVYRDLKPENVLIQENGHLMLVDFDLSTKLAAAKSPATRQTPQRKPQITPKKKKKFALFFNRRDYGISPEYSPQPAADPISDVSNSESDSVEKSNSFVGTEEYVAPEILLGDGHDFAVDMWCLGVMLYEMLYGATPFRGPARKDTFYRIVNKAPDLTGEATPLRDLIRKLLEKDPNKRITIREIKGHDFFKAVDWDLILEMPRPPFIPDLTDVGDMDGNKEIDVESYVQGVFKVDEGEKINKYFEEGQNKDLWANHPQLIHNDNFFIF
ncbi:serine/threonine-protein kinase OXI1-like [Primulina huaijiensis]|uniref:serine/threonine-protein kinase OXI1-like n=1 Tax=Primulina huaijiensis TaxID=1492673 RepID=UPI003CC6EC80